MMGFRTGWSLVMVLFFAVLVGAGSVVYSNHVAAESQRKWCSLISTMDEAYSATPPTTEIGRKLARDIKSLRAEFDCR